MRRKNETITAGLVVEGAVAAWAEMLSGIMYVRWMHEPQLRRGAVVLGLVGESGRLPGHMSD